MTEDLISIKTRKVFRENMVGWVLREIVDEFDAARIDCDLDFQPSVSGQRRTLVEQYYHTIDWTDWRSIKKVLEVFETVIHKAEQPAQLGDEDWQKQRQSELLWCLSKDGLQWVGGRIVADPELSFLNDIKETAAVFDARHMTDQIRRIESAVDSDPSLAIGTAKELIETCCRTILEERGRPVVGTPDISTLTKETLKELKLVPEGVPDARRGSDVIKRILSNLGTIANGLAELRGLYGTGHGKNGKMTSLPPRHAKLAAGAAITLVTFLFETHNEKRQ